MVKPLSLSFRVLTAVIGCVLIFRYSMVQLSVCVSKVLYRITHHAKANQK